MQIVSQWKEIVPPRSNFTLCLSKPYFSAEYRKTFFTTVFLARFQLPLFKRWCPVRTAQSHFSMFVSLTRWNANRSSSLRTAYLIFEAHFKFFFQQFPLVLQLWRFFIKWYQKEWSVKLPVDNGGCHETLNLLHASRCEMLHFVTSYVKQNKSRKQTLESAQNGLEIIFNTFLQPSKVYSWLCLSEYVWKKCLRVRFTAISVNR